MKSIKLKVPTSLSDFAPARKLVAKGLRTGADSVVDFNIRTAVKAARTVVSTGLHGADAVVHKAADIIDPATDKKS